MTLSVWRIGTTKALALDGLAYGSTLESGRWHKRPPEGQPVVYAGMSRAITQLEKRVHCNGFQPINVALLRLDLPDEAVAVDVRSLWVLPPDWRVQQGESQRVGISWRASGQSLALQVPSAVEPEEFNLVLNPDHEHFRRIVLTVERNPFTFDDRLFA